MAKGGPERAVQFLTGAASAGMPEKIVADHISGEMSLDQNSLAAMYRKEVSIPTANKERYQVLASLLATWIDKDFESKLAHITGAGMLSSIMMTTARLAYARGNYKPVSIAEMRDKLPPVVEKIRRGDLTRFVHLISAAHAYGVCMSCGNHVAFSAMQTKQQIAPMRLTFTVGSSWITEASELLVGMEFTPAWACVAGLCARSTCRSTCSNCTTKIGTDYDHEWVVAMREDGMCKACAAKQLINIKRPKFNRREQRQLRRLIIT